MYCKNCAKHTSGVRDESGSFICCNLCGRIMAEDLYSTEAVFIKTAGGSELAGRMVRSVRSDIGESHERTLQKGREEIYCMVIHLRMREENLTTNHAHAFYKIAVERNFTRGRRTSLVAAACLYIACRQKSRPYLLIDFSEYLQQNVYVLGAVFLQLCKLLKLEEHSFVQKPVDPSLFIHRFTETLLKEKNNDVSATAMRIIASMKRDWLQTGRKPSGLCGAALYIAALAHGYKYSKSEVVNVVHVCEQTLTNRLIEFENTESAHLTVKEFMEKASEFDRDALQNQEAKIHSSKSSANSAVLCEHRDGGATHFALNLCRECYKDFIKMSGGLQGGAEPPAFQRAERQRTADADNQEKLQQVDCNGLSRQDEICQDADAICQEEIAPDENINNGQYFSGDPGPTDEAESHNSESLSDIDDDEVIKYLHTEEEKHLKKIIWETMNDDYIKEQAAKEAAADASRTAAYEAKKNSCNGEMLEGAEQLAAAVAAALSKSKKEKQQKRAEEAKNSLPPQTAAEATSRMLAKKRLSSKINYDVLVKLFDDNVTSEKMKRHRTGDDDGQNYEHKEDDRENATEVEDFHIEYDNEYGEYDTGGGANDYLHPENQEDEYYDFDGYDGF